MTIARTQHILQLEATHPALVGFVSGLPDAALDYRVKADDWSIREILAHLVDDEMYVMRTRMERMIKEDVPTLAPHDEKHWYANRNTQRDTLGDLLDDFVLQRSASLGMLKMLRPSDWERRGLQPEYGQFSAEEWLGHWVEHDVTHLNQIEAMVAAFRASETAQQ